jgi:hypothetical protein
MYVMTLLAVEGVEDQTVRSLVEDAVARRLFNIKLFSMRGK